MTAEPSRPPAKRVTGADYCVMDTSPTLRTGSEEEMSKPVGGIVLGEMMWLVAWCVRGCFGC